LAAVMVVALAIPAFGSGGSLFNLASHANSNALKALHRANRALTRASHGMRRGRNARTLASLVSETVDSSRIQSAVAAGTDSTSDDTSYRNLGGPSVTVDVGSSGIIEVWAQVTMSDDGAVSLFQDGQPMPGQSQLCDPLGPGGPGALIASQAGGPTTVGTPGIASFVLCGTDGPPGPVLFQTSAGTHTYDLRYISCGCTGSPIDFSNRKLFVAPRL
jgi:hypothetical protein